MWLRWYKWLEMGQTPMSMGLVRADELDPRYFDAMEFVDVEVVKLRNELIRKR